MVLQVCLQESYWHPVLQDPTQVPWQVPVQLVVGSSAVFAITGLLARTIAPRIGRAVCAAFLKKSLLVFNSSLMIRNLND